MLINNEKYFEIVENIKSKIKNAQYRAAVSVNSELIMLYHLNLRCYVVIELKTGDFKPEYAGQLNFYLSAVDGMLKKDTDNPSIGLLLCKNKNNLVAEYALKDMSKPMGVSQYEITKNLPKEYEKQLPTVEDLQNRIKE